MYVVGVPVFADKGMAIPLALKIIDKIFHDFGLDAVEDEAALLVPVATQVRKSQHLADPRVSARPGAAEIFPRLIRADESRE